MFIMTWQCISAEVTVKGFKKCCITNAMDGTDCDMIWNGSSEDGKFRSSCEEDEGTDCGDGDSDTCGDTHITAHLLHLSATLPLTGSSLCAAPAKRPFSGHQPNQAKVLTGGGDLREAQVDVPLSVSHSYV